MPSKNKTTPTPTPTKEPEPDPSAAAEIAALKAQIARLGSVLPPTDGIISTPVPNPWHVPGRNSTLLQPPPVASQAAPAGPARALNLEEEKEDPLAQVRRLLDKKTADKGFIITPKFAEGTSDFVKHLRSAIDADTDFDRTGYVKTLMTVLSTFAGRNLSAAHIDSPALEQLAIVLAAQRVSNVHTEYGYYGEGTRNQDKGLTEGDIRWLHPVIRYLQAPTIREEFSIPIDLCRSMKMPSPTTEPNAYLAVAELNGFIQSVLATMREQLQRAGLSSHLTAPGLAVTPVIGVDTDTLSLIKNFINANKPPVQTKNSIREAVNHINDDIATDTTEVTSGILNKYLDRASKLKAFLVDFQTQGLSEATDYGIVNDIQLTSVP